MTLLVPDEGEGTALENFLNKTAPQNPVLKLYTNNHAPAETDTAASFTEASGFGYAAVTLTGSSWTVTTGAPTHADFAQQIFTFTGNLGNVYGYFVVQTTSGKCMFAELFSDGPYNVVNNGDQIKITPRIEAA